MLSSQERGAESDPISERESVDKIASTVRLLAKVIVGCLGLLFTALLVKDFPLQSMMENTSPEVVLKLTVAFYYLLWVLRVNIDISVQQAAYARDPLGGKLTWDSFLALVLITVSAAVIFWASDSYKKLAPTLSVFVIIYIISWRLLLRRLRPIMDASETSYRQRAKYFEWERLQLVEQYIAGAWQWWRFLAMIAAIIVVDVESFSESGRAQSAYLLHLLFPNLDEGVILALLPSLAIVVFILVGESWMWTKSIKTLASIRVLAHLKTKYSLIPNA
jgi:hypothetical protein